MKYLIILSLLFITACGDDSPSAVTFEAVNSSYTKLVDDKCQLVYGDYWAVEGGGAIIVGGFANIYETEFDCYNNGPMLLYFDTVFTSQEYNGLLFEVTNVDGWIYLEVSEI